MMFYLYTNLLKITQLISYFYHLSVSQLQKNYCFELSDKINSIQENYHTFYLTVDRSNFKLIFFFLSSASGTSAVAIDNKIEQAMVSYRQFFLYFNLF